MQRDKQNWRANRAVRALKTLSEIEASIVSLGDEDLLDLHDIFAGSPAGALATLASAEMVRRNLTA
jgi:hypothetical protein